jgi:hypothetical protein
MSLKRGSVNALNVLGVRRLSYIPEHFSTMIISDQVSSDKIDSWVYQNLDSRYSIIKSLKLDASNKMVEIHELGVEDAKELTILSLSCPYFDKNT